MRSWPRSNVPSKRWRRNYRGDPASFLPSRQAWKLLENAGALERRSLPRTVPWSRLEHVAAMMASDLLGEKPQVEVDDLPTLFLKALFQSRTWKVARELAKNDPDLVAVILRGTVPKMLEMVDGGLQGLDWRDATEEERHRTEEAVERLLNVSGERPVTDPEERRWMRSIMCLLIRSLDRRLAPVVEVLRQETDTLARLEEILPGQGWDLHRVALHRTFLGDLERYADILRRHKDVQRLKEVLGRMEGERERPSTSLSQSPMETHSLRFSGDLQRMLPQELVNLGDERLKLLFYARMCERRLLTYQLRGKEEREGERRRGGPVVALLDCSGSMSGELELTAKALLLALTHHLLEENRPLRAVLFSVDMVSYDLTSADGAVQFLDLLCQTFEGGTDFDAALRKGVKSLEEPRWQGADLLFITDGLARIRDRGCLHDWNCMKERQGSHIFTIIIGGQDAGGLKSISDRVFIMSRQGEWAGGSLLQELFSH